MPAPELHSEWFRVGGHRLHVRISTHPDPTAPTVLIVHGMVVSSLYSVPLAEELAKSTSVFAIDLPGYGRSSKPCQFLDTAELGGVVNAWLSQTGLHDVVVVANSYGCQVMTEAVIADRTRIRSLIFVGPTIDQKAPGGLLQALRIARAVPFEPWWFLPVALQGLCTSGLRRAVHDVRNMSRHEMVNRAALIPVKVDVVRGVHDYVCNERWAMQLAAQVGGVCTTLKPGAHIVHGSRPAAVARVVLKALERAHDID